MSFPVPSFLSYPTPLVNSNRDSGNGLPFPINGVVFNLLTSTCALKQGWRDQIFRYYSLDKQRIEGSRPTYAAVNYLRIWKYRYPRQSPLRGLKKSMKIKRNKRHGPSEDKTQLKHIDTALKREHLRTSHFGLNILIYIRQWSLHMSS